MAGDWIVMRVKLHEDPAVISMSESLGMDDYGVVGRLHRLWAWADANTTNGRAPVTEKSIDKLAAHEGFAKAMQQNGWLKIDEKGVTFLKWTRHNFKSAKRRAEDAARKAEGRKKSAKCPQNVRTEKRTGSGQNGDHNTEQYKTIQDRKDCKSPSPSTTSARPNGDGALVMQWGKKRDDSDLLSDSKVDELFGMVVTNGFAHDTHEDRVRFFGLVFNLRRQGSATFGLLTRIIEGAVKSRFHKSTDWRSRASDADLDRARKALKALDADDELEAAS